MQRGVMTTSGGNESATTPIWVESSGVAPQVIEAVFSRLRAREAYTYGWERAARRGATAAARTAA